jgi:predicted dehydrogenase
MRFALLGEGPTAIAVARAVVASSSHRLICQVRVESLDGPQSSTAAIPKAHSIPFLPGLRTVRTWTELLTDPDIDAIIVAGQEEELQPIVRQLVQAGKSVLVAPELVQSAAFFYELALVESEQPGRIFPMLGLRGHPLVARLQELISQGGLGNIRHVQFDRKIASHSVNGRALMSQFELANALLIDADLLRILCGSYDQVTASRSGDAAKGYSLTTVMLAGSSVPQTVWTAAAHVENKWAVTVSGDAGTAVLEGNPIAGGLTLTRHRTPATPFAEEAAVQETAVEETAVEENGADPGNWLLEMFTLSQVPQSKSQTPADGRPEDRPESNLWAELARAVELVDAVERSVRRRRTIDVYFETPSERGIFKTQMTAVGCSLLMLTLAAVVFYLLFAWTIPMPPLMKRVLVILIFLPLGAFLALQLLVFVARPAGRDVR